MPEAAMSLVKNLLYGLGALGWASRLRNGTWKYLRDGYAPKRFWEEWGERFPRQRYQRGIHAGQEWLRSRITGRRAETILEVGCGFGRNLEYLFNRDGEAERKDPIRIFGVDISTAMLRRGLAGRPAGCGLAAGDVLALPFADRRFDLVYTHGLLMHVPPADLHRALAEIRRVAAGEVLFVEETYWDGLMRSGTVDVNGYTYLHDYPSALQAAGFAILDSSESGGHVNLACYRCRP
jgi:SAM-dependent methyltransferase